MNILESDKDELKEVITSEKEINNTLRSDLEDARAIILDKENLTSDLYSQLSHCQESGVSSQKPHVLVVTDKCMDKIKGYMPDTFIFEYEYTESMKKLNEMLKSDVSNLRFAKYDMVLVFLGTIDIKEDRTQGSMLFRLMEKTVAKLSKLTNVCVVQLPPINIPLLRGDPGSYNWNTMNKWSNKGTELLVLSEKIQNKSASKLLERDGFTLSKEGGLLFGELVSEKLIIPTTKPKVQEVVKIVETNYPVYEDDDATEFVDFPAKSIGLVIGSEGKTIQGITRENKVKMTIGKFVAENKKGSDLEKNGAIIMGKRNNVIAAKKRVRDLVDNDTYEKDSKKRTKDE